MVFLRFLFCVSILAGLAVCWANPLPMGGTYFHVQPVDPQFCSNCAITECPQIVQHTTETGLLEFDLFVEHVDFIWGTEHIAELDCEIGWSPSFSLIETQYCHGAMGYLSMNGSNGATLEVYWLDCPEVAENVWLVGRFVFQVSGPGQVGVHDASLVLGCPPDQHVESDLGSAPGIAGVGCSHCDVPCGFRDPCHGIFWPDLYEAELAPDDSIVMSLEAVLSGNWGVGPCSGSIVDDAPWLEVLEPHQEWFSAHEIREVPVRIDTAGLLPGSYEALVRFQSEDACVGCASICLLVTGTQGVSSPALEETTWGRLRTRYR